MDTGACTSLLRLDVWQKLRCKGPLRKPDEIVTINDSPVTLLGKCEIKFDNTKPIPVSVIRDMRHQFILGSDALSMGQAKIDYQHKTLSWFGNVYDLGSIPSKRIGSVSVSTSYSQIDTVLNRYRDVFDRTRKEGGRHPSVRCTIPTGNHPPISQRAYRMPLMKQRVVRKEIDDMLKLGVIRPSSSSWSSPITLVPKKDGSVRFCIDYRKLNSIVHKDKYPLPLISDIFDQLSGSSIFSTLDLKSGYWQIPMHSKDIPKTAFICSEGLFEWTVMPFGFCNSGQIFQRAMNEIFREFVGKFVFVYVDDIVIFSKTPEEHAKHLEKVLKKLKDYNLQVKYKKCTFAAPSVDLLGYRVGATGISPQPQKVECIKQMSPPTTVREIRSLLGMTGYYRACIPNYANIVEPLYFLTRKHVRFKWGVPQQKAFETLKSILLSDIVLAYPNLQQPYKLYTDASSYAIGGILTQTDDQGIEKIVQYVSTTLKGSQLKWPVIEKEAYAVIFCLQKLRPYLYGATFTVYTDHKPLKALFVGEIKNTKVQRWAVLLAEHACKIEYIRGNRNVRADMLSRLRRPSEVATYDTGDYTIPDVEGECLPHIPLQNNDIELAALKKHQLQEFGDIFKDVPDDYMVHEGILYSVKTPSPLDASYPRVILPSPFRERVIQKAHDLSAHQGLRKTLCLIRDHFVWPGMRKNVCDVIDKCARCQVSRPIHTRPRYNEMPLAKYPGQIIGMDLIGPLPHEDGRNAFILTIVDHCSGWAECFPIPSKAAIHVEAKFFDEYLPRHGIPEIVITDLGREFNSNSLKLKFRQLGIDHRKTTAYHPQTNGKTERFNRTLKNMLEKLLNNRARLWEIELPAALTAYRNTVHSSTGFTPFFLLYGRRARLPFSIPVDATADLSDRLTALGNALCKAREITSRSRAYNRTLVNKRANAKEFRVGDTVVLKADERITFTSRNDPEFEITKLNGPVAHIRHSRSGKTKTVNISKLRVVDPQISWGSIAPRPVRNTSIGTNRSLQRAEIHVPFQKPDWPDTGAPTKAQITGTTVDDQPTTATEIENVADEPMAADDQSVLTDSVAPAHRYNLRKRKPRALAHPKQFDKRRRLYNIRFRY